MTLKTQPMPTTSEPIRDIDSIKTIKDMLRRHKQYLKHFLFTVGINSGLRVSDLLELRFKHFLNTDMSLKKSFSFRASKNNKVAITQINVSIQKSIEQLSSLSDVSELDDLVFPVTRQSVSRWVKLWCNQVGMDGNYSAHSLRKTYAYQLWDKLGRDFESLLIVSQALGHSDPGTTITYLGLRQQKVKQAQESLNL